MRQTFREAPYIQSPLDWHLSSQPLLLTLAANPGVLMKLFASTMLIALALMLVGCGSDNSSNNAVNGNWTVSLTDANSTPVFGFTTTLTQSGSTVSGTNLSFTTATPCFGSDSTETG